MPASQVHSTPFSFPPLCQAPQTSLSHRTTESHLCRGSPGHPEPRGLSASLLPTPGPQQVPLVSPGLGPGVETL